MLPSAHRLRRSAQFGQTVRRGARVGRSTVVVHLLVDDEGGAAPLVGFVVSKAVGNAVQRNRVKRRLREIVRQLLVASDGDTAAEAPALALPGHTRAVVRALPASSTATYAELTRDVVMAFTKASFRVTAASPS